MAIKVTVDKNQASAQNFPCLLATPFFDDVQIILATGVNEESGNFIGTNVNGKGWEVGHHSNEWDKKFAPWPGSVTLCNAPKE